MPNAKTIDKIGVALSASAADASDLADRLREASDLIEALEAEVELESHEVDYLSSIPFTLREALRVAAAEALAQGKSVHVQFSPGYDFSVSIWDYGSGVSLHVSGPYPPEFPRAAYLGNETSA